MFRLTYISTILFITTLVNLLAAMISWQRRNSRDGWYFALAMSFVTFWTLTSSLDYAAVPWGMKIFFAKLETIGYNGALAFFVLFAISYSGHLNWLKPAWAKILLAIIPVSNILLAWTNEWHGWMWSGYRLVDAANNVLLFEHGPGFFWAAVGGYLMVAMIAACLLQVAFASALRSRRQARMLLAAMGLLVASNLLYQFDTFHMPGVDWTSVSFSLNGLLFLAALYGERFLDIAPIARNALIEQMGDGVLVLDLRGNLVDCNPAARRMLHLTRQDMWKPIQASLLHWPELLAWLSGEPAPPLREFTFDRPEQVCEARLTPLEDQRGLRYGSLVVMQDITGRRRMEETTRQSEEKFQKAFQSSPDGIIISRQADGRIVDVNDAYTRMTGYAREELFSQTTIRLGLWVNPTDRDELLEDLQREGRVRDKECLFRQKNGELFYALVSVEIINLENTDHLISTIRDITERKRGEAQLLAAQSQLHEQQNKLARIEERQRMGRTLHDSLSQSIHSLLLFTETLEVVIGKGNLERARQIAAQVEESARQAHKETRLMLFELQNSGSGRRIDLLHNLEERLEKVERHAGMYAELQSEGALDCFPEDCQENLYWIAIEALNNAIKHSQARHVQVALHCSPERLELRVSDDGKGFDPARVHHGGMGLENMRARAAQLDGELEIMARPNGGTLVRFWKDRELASGPV